MSLPNEVRVGQQSLADWLNNFVHKTQEQVEKQLGTKSEKTTWVYQEKKELRLAYKTSEQGTLTLYFLGSRVITANYDLNSD